KVPADRIHHRQRITRPAVAQPKVALVIDGGELARFACVVACRGRPWSSGSSLLFSQSNQAPSPQNVVHRRASRERNLRMRLAQSLKKLLRAPSPAFSFLNDQVLYRRVRSVRTTPCGVRAIFESRSAFLAVSITPHSYGRAAHPESRSHRSEERRVGQDSVR